MITITINGLIVVLLVGAIGYTYLMDLRVRKLLAALNELEPMVGQFSKAVQQSETSLKKFKQAARLEKHLTKPVESSTKVSKSVGGNKLNFETNRKPPQKYVGKISLSEKSELVRSFFAKVEKQGQ